MSRHRSFLRILAKNLPTIVGLVLVWRGVWYMLDAIDLWMFGGSHATSAILGIVLGIAILYLPDHDLKEIEKL